MSTGTLNFIYERFTQRQLVNKAWMDTEQYRAEWVKIYREYYRGEHQVRLNTEMKKMLRIDNAMIDRFNANYCKLVVDTLKNRLIVDGIKITTESADSAGDVRAILGDLGLEAAAVDALLARFRVIQRDETGQAWVDDLIHSNRFDALQTMVHKAVVRDGNTYLMSEYDDDTESVTWAHERAFDGDTGMIVVYDDRRRHIVAAAKVWHQFDGVRLNLYYPDVTERYLARGDGDTAIITSDFEFLGSEPTIRLDQAPGVPVVHFYINPEEGHGVSILRDVVPLQNTLNSTLVSMVMSSELAAFAIFFVVGFDMGNNLMPGSIIRADVVSNGVPWFPDEDPELLRARAELLNAMRLERIQGGSLVEYIRQAEFTISQIGAISNTPLPQNMGGDSQSGEALKERQAALVAAVDEAHVHLGNSWEDVITLSSRQTELFGQKIMPKISRINTTWKTSETRNNVEIVSVSQWLNNAGFERESLRVLSASSIVDYDEEYIDKLMREKQADTEAAIGAAAQSLPGFAEFAPLA